MRKVELDPVPTICAGIETIRCECGYETTVIVPEETHVLICKIVEHIQQHGIQVPQFTVEMH